MGIIAPRSDQEALSWLVVRFFRPSGPLMSGTKKAGELAAAELNGLRDGLSEAIAAFLSVRRVDLYPHIKDTNRFIEAIGGYEVKKLLMDLKAGWELAGTTPERDIAISEAVDWLWSLMGDKNLAEWNEDVRRDKVRAGRLKPVESDREWLEAEVSEARSSLDAIADILNGTEALPK